MERKTAEAIKIEAVRQGMTTLRYSGWEKVLAGITTPEEVLETTEEDRLDLFEWAPGPEMPKVLPKAVAEPSKAEAKPLQVVPAKTSGRSPDFQYINLRKFQRIACEVPLFFKILDYQGDVPLIVAARTKLAPIEFEGHTRDISGGGVYFSVHEQLMPDKKNTAGEMAFSLSQALESGSILEIKIVLPNSERPVRCMGKILRVTQSRELIGENEELFCRVGASFLAIDSEDRCRLIRFCETSKESHEAV